MMRLGADMIILASIVLIVGGVGVGSFYLGVEHTKLNADSCKQYDGCWASVKAGQDAGEWVCVNIQDMEWERAVEVCHHEVGHEIFAEVCEDNIQGCMDIARGGISREK